MIVTMRTDLWLGDACVLSELAPWPSDELLPLEPTLEPEREAGATALPGRPSRRRILRWVNVPTATTTPAPATAPTAYTQGCVADDPLAPLPDCSSEGLDVGPPVRAQATYKC